MTVEVKMKIYILNRAARIHSNIYSSLSYDAREHSWNKGSRWSDEFMFGDRAYFDLSGPAALVVEDIRPQEAGVYRCRVDFKSAPTRNTLVNVTLLGEWCPLNPPEPRLCLTKFPIINLSGCFMDENAKLIP